MKLRPFRFAPFQLAGLLCFLTVLFSSTSLHAAAKAKLPGADLFTDDQVTRIDLEITPADMEDLLQTQKFKGQGERKSYSVVVREGGRVYERVDMHLKGAIGSFRPITNTPSLTLNFDKHLPEQTFHGLKKLSLNNSVQDPSRVSERFARELYRAAGVPAPRVGVATLRLNGRDLGVFLLVEGYNRQFLKQHFKNPDGNLYDGGLAEEVDTTGKQPVNSGRHPQDQSRLKDLLAAAQDPDSSRRLPRLEAVLDVERFLSMLAMDVMINHWDGYPLNRNNYRVFHDLSSNRIVFLPHGLDQTFQNPKAGIAPRVPGLISRVLLENPESRRRYLRRVAELTEKHFDAHAMTNRILQLAAPIGREMATREAKPAAEQKTALNDYIAHVAERCVNLRQQLAGATQPLPFDASGSALLQGWKPWNEFGQAKFEGTNATDRALVIRADGGAVIGRWSKRVWLEKGRYRLEGSLRTMNVTPVPGTARGGAALRPSNRHASEYAVGSQDWKTAKFDFEIFDPIYEIELLCELRAGKGEAQFDTRSLRLVRLGKE